MIEVTIARVNMYIKIYKAVHFKSVQFIVCQLPLCSLSYVNYLDKVVLKKKGQDTD